MTGCCGLRYSLGLVAPTGATWGARHESDPIDTIECKGAGRQRSVELMTIAALQRIADSRAITTPHRGAHKTFQQCFVHAVRNG